jgi:transcriptional regulator with XRE-family HTH domain
MQGVVYIGDRLKNLRMRRALMQYELADRVGISSDSLNGTELSKAEPQMSIPRKLARALDVDLTNS